MMSDRTPVPGCSVWRLSDTAERLYARHKERKQRQFPGEHKEYEYALSAFGDCPFGNPYKHEFLLLTMCHQWPSDFLLEREGVVNHWAIRMAKAFCRYKRLSIIGCGSSWKTGNVSAYLYTAWKANPFCTSVFLSTTSGEAAQSRTWGQIKDWHTKDKYAVGKRIESLHLITLDEEARDEEGNKARDFRNSIKVVLIKPGAEGKNVMASIVGRKNEYVYWAPQPLSEKVLTPQGWKRFGDIKVGDAVIGSQGTPVRVTHVHPIQKKKIKKVTFFDKSVVRCSEDHLWTLTDRTNANPTYTKPLSYFEKRLHDFGGTARWSTPRLPVVQFDPIPAPKISAYIIGALLGDGHIRKSTTLYNYDEDVVEEFQKELPDGYVLSCYGKERGQYYVKRVSGEGGIRKNTVTRELKRLGILGTDCYSKFVPREFLFGSPKTRISLLQGLLDTDGTVLNSTVRYTSVSPQLRKDVIHLVRSLGGYARESLPYTVVINLEGVQLFRCKRKLARVQKCKFKQRRKAIVSIEDDGEEDARCITVSAPDGLYVTSDFVLTHNCDEMCFMDIGILNARVNLNTNPFYQFLGLSNAPEEGDPMYIDAEPAGDGFPDGWRSVDKDAHEEWPTKGGHCVYFNGAKSPNYSAPNPDKPPFRKMMNENIRKEILLDAGGEDTPMYWKQFYGFPPSVDISDKVITFKILEQNGAFGGVEWADATAKPLAGLDLGFRAGGDPCVIHFGKVGKAMSGRRVLGAERDGVALLPAQGSRDPFEVQIAKKVVGACRERGCHDIALDVTGDGGILMQHIEREARESRYELNVLPVSFSGTAEDRIIIPGERRKANEMFQNMVCQLWASVRLSVLNKVVFGLGERGQCVSQLCSRKMGSDEKKRMTIESKKDMKKRLRRSPDQADAFCLLHHLALRHGLDGQQRAGVSAEEVVKKVMGNAQQAAGRYGGHSSISRYANR